MTLQDPYGIGILQLIDKNEKTIPRGWFPMTCLLSTKRNFTRTRYVLPFILLLTAFLPATGSAGLGPLLSSGQTVYVPIYSNIYAGPRNQPVFLTATLSVRNTDPDHPIVIESVKYYGTTGQLLKEYLKKPLSLGPLGSTHVVVDEADESGGPGAKFIVSWKSDRTVNVPVIQGIMVTTRSGQGISFVTDGRVINEATR